MIDIAANLDLVRTRMERAAARADRNLSDVTLVAVSKTRSAAEIEISIAAGVSDIGENYVQEAAEKRGLIAKPVRWHMIGPLQRNKARRAAALFDCFHTVDRIELAVALQRAAEEGDRSIHALVEVNISGESTKSGVAPAALPQLLAALRPMSRLEIDGLMCIPTPDSADSGRYAFRHLRSLRDQYGLRELSMGMTDDFEIAIEEGATMIRVGRAIFGPRPRRK